MDPLEQKLRALSAAKILDVAAGRGGSLKYLIDTLGSWTEAVGVDISEKNITKARETITNPHVSFDIMSADALSFDDNSFDMVTNINSLHHLEYAEQALSEMYRVLKPGGTFLLCDMYPETDNELQLSHVYLHHWWAEVDQLSGIPHFETYRRARMVQMVEALGLSEAEFIDQVDTTPIEKQETLDYLINACDDYMKRLTDKPERRDLLERGKRLKERITSTGIAWASQLCVLGVK